MLARTVRVRTNSHSHSNWCGALPTLAPSWCWPTTQWTFNMSLLCSLRVSLCRVRHCPVAYHCMVQNYPHLLLRGAVRTKVISYPLPHHVRVQTYSTVTILSNSRLIRVRMWCIIRYHHTFIILPLFGGNIMSAHAPRTWTSGRKGTAVMLAITASTARVRQTQHKRFHCTHTFFRILLD